jgi:hypothetical protein
MNSGHNEVAYNQPPHGRVRLCGRNYLEDSPLVGWRFYPASPCELSTRNVRRDNHPSVRSCKLPKWVRPREEITIGHGTNWALHCPPNSTNSKWVDAERNNRLSHLSFTELTKIGKQMWQNKKIDEKFFFYKHQTSYTRKGSRTCRSSNRVVALGCASTIIIYGMSTTL